MSFFSWLCVSGNDDQRAVAARIGDERQPDAGVAGRGLDDRARRADLAALLRFQDDLPRRPVLDRLSRDS